MKDIFDRPIHFISIFFGFYFVVNYIRKKITLFDFIQKCIIHTQMLTNFVQLWLHGHTAPILTNRSMDNLPLCAVQYKTNRHRACWIILCILLIYVVLNKNHNNIYLLMKFMNFAETLHLGGSTEIVVQYCNV